MPIDINPLTMHGKYSGADKKLELKGAISVRF